MRASEIGSRGTARVAGTAESLAARLRDIGGRAVHDLRVVTWIFIWELRGYFRKPTSCVLLLACTLVAGWNFSLLVTLLSTGRVVPVQIADEPLAQFLGPNVFLVFSLMMVLPVVTMGVVADERRRGIWEMLLTAPVDVRQVIWAKFAAAWCVVVLNTLPWVYFISVLYLFGGGDFDVGHLIGGCAGIATNCLTLCAIGVFCSACCRTPFAAAVATVGATIGLLLLSLLPRVLEYWRLSPLWVSSAKWLACWEHLAEFSSGVIDPRIVIGHITAAAVFLWLAVQVSELRQSN